MIRNPNHPKPGSTIKADPIRSLNAIRSIKRLLRNNPRNLCLFVLGINTNLKAIELLGLKAGMVRKLKPGEILRLAGHETKSDKEIVLNKPCIQAIQKLLSSRKFKDNDYLFCGPKGVLRLPSLNRLIKQWCEAVDLKGNYGTHTMRKTFGYQQGVRYGVALPTLMKTLNHTTQRETLNFLGLKKDQIKSIFENEI